MVLGVLSENIMVEPKHILKTNECKLIFVSSLPLAPLSSKGLTSKCVQSQPRCFYNKMNIKCNSSSHFYYLTVFIADRLGRATVSCLAQSPAVINH